MERIEFMILADKIIYLRKKNGWSQEQLAEQLNISRQSVSKWESGASIPDLDKILKMSKIFDVSTDFLLKDEIEEELPSEVTYNDEEMEGRLVSLEEANEYMETVKQAANRIGIGVALCILSPVIVIMLGICAESGVIGITEDMAGGFGTALLLVMVAIGVCILVVNVMRLSKYEYLEKETNVLQYGVQGIVEKKKHDLEPTYRTYIALGVAICIVGVCPLLIAAGFDARDLVLGFCISVMLGLIACAVFMFISKGMVWSAYEKLLQEGDFTPDKKKMEKRTESFSGIYWCTMTAIYLGVSFYTNAWYRTWIIWPVASVAFAAMKGLVGIILGKDRR